MKGLRWLLGFLRDPVGTIDSSVAIVRARIVPFESRIRLALTEALHNAARTLALGLAALALALVGAVYVLMGLWLGLSRYLGPVGASFALGALFLIASLAFLAVLYSSVRESGRPSDEPR